MGTAFRELLFKAPSLLVLAGCVVYYARTRSSEGLLALVGQMIAVVLSAVSVGMVFSLAGQNLTPEAYKCYAPWVRVGGFGGAILFALAFLKIAAGQPQGRNRSRSGN